MTDQKIRTRPDGSIDTAFYMQRGRRLRSEAAHGMVAGLRGAIGPSRPQSAAATFGWPRRGRWQLKAGW